MCPIVEHCFSHTNLASFIYRCTLSGGGPDMSAFLVALKVNFSDSRGMSLMIGIISQARPLGTSRVSEIASHSMSSPSGSSRSEEHTSELQSPCNLVCRLLLE